MKAKRASSNAKESLALNQIFMKQEKRNKIISSAFQRKKRESVEYGDTHQANIPGKIMLI